MLEPEPLWYPSRGPFSPGISNRQLWAIGMIVVQWGMAEFIRDQCTFNLMDTDSLIERYKSLKNSQQKTKFWKGLVETKTPEPERARDLKFISRFESLNNKRDDVVHRLWGGGIESGTSGAPADVKTADAGLHRNRDEKIKTKSKDARANFRWRLSFRRITRDRAQHSAAQPRNFNELGTTGGTAGYVLHLGLLE